MNLNIYCTQKDKEKKDDNSKFHERLRNDWIKRENQEKENRLIPSSRNSNQLLVP